jgi:alkylation response protein AidB-like acyl-CoA dehydrogenase
VFLTTEQKKFQKEIKAFAEENFRGTMMDHTRGPEFPFKSYQLVCDRGYMGLMLPAKFGGSGKGVVEYCILLEELSRVDHNVAWVLDSSFGVSSVIARLGTEAQKEKYLPDIISGKLRPTFGLSDLTGGSNVKEMGTWAKLHDDGTWTITGRKVHIHNCDHANLWLIFAGSDYGQEALLVESTDNIRIERKYQPFGFRCAPCYQILLDNVVVGKDGLLGQRGKGLMAALTGALNYTRTGNASIVIGIARAALDVTMSFMMGRKIKDGYLSDQQAIQHIIADLATDLEAASLLRWQAAFLHDQGDATVKEASQAKLFATERASNICGTLLRLLGAYGCYEEFPLADYLASCKTLEIGSGASEIHRNNIAREVLREYDRRFESGELMEWAQTDAQRHLLSLNERSSRIMNK